jgi:hypothetical protein
LPLPADVLGFGVAFALAFGVIVIIALEALPLDHLPQLSHEKLEVYQKSIALLDSSIIGFSFDQCSSVSSNRGIANSLICFSQNHNTSLSLLFNYLSQTSTAPSRSIPYRKVCEGDYGLRLGADTAAEVYIIPMNGQDSNS